MHKTVADWFCRGQRIEGEVGIEIELEGEDLPDSIPKLSSQKRKFWTVTRDGSLRGDAYEYVLDGPVSRDEIDVALSQLYRKLDSSNLLDSGRAGVHVHVNVRDLTLTQMFTFVLLYLVFEKVLVRYCGTSREGNLFCLRVCDAEYLAMALLYAIRNKRVDRLGSDDLRYASINLTALRKYGSLEFRAMRSPVGKEVIKNWTDILLQLKDASLKFKDPEELMLGVSSEGGYDFARINLGDKIELLEGTNWNEEVLAGLRMIQPLVKALSAQHRKPVNEEKPLEVKRVDVGQLYRDFMWQGDPLLRVQVEEAPEPPATRLLRIKRQILGLPRMQPETFHWLRG